MFNISVNFKNTKKADHILKASEALSLYFDVIEDDFQVVF